MVPPSLSFALRLSLCVSDGGVVMYAVVGGRIKSGVAQVGRSVGEAGLSCLGKRVSVRSPSVSL